MSICSLDSLVLSRYAWLVTIIPVTHSGEIVLMSGHNMCFYGEMWEITP